MKNIKISCTAHDSFIMPGEIIPLLSKINETQLKVFVYCMSTCEFELTSASEGIGVSVADFEDAVKFWIEAGLISGGEQTAAAPKRVGLIQSYDGETLAQAMKDEHDFASLKDTVEEMLGKVLNKNDISLLYNIYHFSGLGADFVCTLVAYAVARGKANMRYITQTALSLYDEGVDTYEKLEATLSAKQKHEDMKSRFITLCGFGARKLSAKEESYITRWFTDFDLPFDVIKTAYEKMIDMIGEVKLPYLDKILTDWHERGVRSGEDAQKTQNQRSKGAKTLPADSFDINEFIEAAMKRGVN
ncbi:MAG: DnaD domain protein [Eubacteriales bacterium]|nr:DnaD domain protein [Eubacteriales bacterium]